jgi:hypothetical protein
MTSTLLHMHDSMVVPDPRRVCPSVVERTHHRPLYLLQPCSHRIRSSLEYEWSRQRVFRWRHIGSKADGLAVGSFGRLVNVALAVHRRPR